MPDWDPNKLQAAETSYIYDHKGQLTSKLHAIEDRENVSLSRMPADLKTLLSPRKTTVFMNTTVSAGFDCRAILANLTSGWGAEGQYDYHPTVNHAFFGQNKRRNWSAKSRN